MRTMWLAVLAVSIIGGAAVGCVTAKKAPGPEKPSAELTLEHLTQMVDSRWSTVNLAILPAVVADLPMVGLAQHQGGYEGSQNQSLFAPSPEVVASAYYSNAGVQLVSAIPDRPIGSLFQCHDCHVSKLQTPTGVEPVWATTTAEGYSPLLL